MGKIKFVNIVFVPLFLAIASSSFCQSLLTYTKAKGEVVPVKTLFEWQIKRTQVLDSMQALFGTFPGDPNMPPFDSRIPGLPAFNTVIIDSIKTNLYTRYNIRFTVAKGEDVTAYLYIPLKKEKGTRCPAMLALHQTEGIGKGSVDGQGPYINLAYAKELAQRGYIVIAPDYPGFGDQANYNFDTDRYESGIMKAVFNNIRCVDFLQNRKDVDPERIGIIGHSLGGHTAMYTAAFDTRIKVIVSSCGWTLRRYYNNYDEEMKKKYGSRLWGMTQQRYSPLALTKYQLKVERMPFDFDELIAVLAPRPFFSNSPIHDANFNVEGVRVGIANVSEVYHFLNADDNLQVRYPVASHDFPLEVRFEAYDFIDKYLKK
jgi:dienelactone hydrolase